MTSFFKTLYILPTLVLCTLALHAHADNSQHVTVINPIIVPTGKEAEALAIWDRYAEYFSKQPGYIGTKLHKALDPEAKFHYINVAEWKSADDFVRALNSDDLKSIGKGFPQDMPHYPSMYQVIRK